MSSEQQQDNNLTAANEPLMQEKKPIDLEKGSYEQAVFTKDVDQVEVKAPPQFIGLTKEELEHYRNDPFWKRLRMILFILFWLAWILMFVAAIVIVAVSPKCPPKIVPHWWQSKLCYQVWTSSFKDSDGNGVGDLGGLKDKLDSLKKVGIQTIWPVQLLQSKALGGYEVSDFKKIDKRIGTNEDFKNVVKSAHGKIPKMYVIMDFPTTTSTDHEWFKKSSAKTSGYEDFYFWSDSDPGDAKYYTEDGGRYYLHVKEKTDMAVLNWEAVQQNMTDVLTHWLNQGVDGFYLGHVPYMSGKLPSNAEWDTIYGYLKTLSDAAEDWKNGTGDMARQLLLFTALDETNQEEIANNLVVKGGMNYVINKDLMKFDGSTSNLATELKNAIEDKVKFHEQYNETWPMWEVGTPYISRLASRFESRTVGELMNFVLLSLPGSINVYYGDEILMVDYNGSDPDYINKVMRTPMQWDDSANAGFSTASADKLTMPVNADYKTVNFQAQYGDSGTALKMFKRIAKLRQTDDTFLRGNYTLGSAENSVFTFARFPPAGHGTIYVGGANFGDSKTKVDFSEEFLGGAKEGGTVLTATSNVAETFYERAEIGDMSSVELGPKQGLIIKYQPAG